MQARIIKPGLLTTVQDMGRYGYLAQAVPVSGVMDSLSARVANKAIGNADNAAVIEFTYAGAEWVATADILIAYAGDGAMLVAGQQAIPPQRPIFIPTGTVIILKSNPLGSRTYLAVAGGWDVPEVLGSRSTFLTAGFGGFNGRALAAGDVLNNCGSYTPVTQQIFSNLRGHSINYPQWSIARQLLWPTNGKQARVVLANESNWFDDDSIADFLSGPYKLGQQSNRMGCHLEGLAMQRIKLGELLSTAVAPGTIQVTGNGSLLLLMADCQTTGGYPRIARVAAVDMPLCAQLKPGDTIYFKAITSVEAEMLYIEREQQLQQLTTAIMYQFL